MYSNQANFWNGPMYNTTENSVKQQLATLISSKFNLT